MEMQIKTTRRCPYIPIRMTKNKHLTTSSVSKGAEQLELPCIAGGNAKWYSHFGRKLSSFL